ncbi:hypothetical protein ARMSODRAFT_1026885 [Armillaria solidipes]|uniref:Tyrosinase copper-binding domain-containing protein n=1 Tax=Armillaria solidipes TaxID=1076256 RepID=A0A2H3AMN4_9AGAR|nr:hypothetical protein ARMSODRAFT_1026885 [Armillaria solidipes]
MATIWVAGRMGLGRDISDVMTSPDDPIFWKHHGYSDYNVDLGNNETRIHDLEGAGNKTALCRLCSPHDLTEIFEKPKNNTVLYMFNILRREVLHTQDNLMLEVP